MRYLNAVDYTVIAFYSAVLLAIGLYLRRKASASLEDYFLAGRKLPWWALGISGMTNFLDMTGTMIIVSFLYMLGPRGLYIEFRGGAVLVLAFMLLWAGKWHWRSRCMTGAEWHIFRFGSTGMAQAARLIAAFAGVVLTVGMLAYLIKGAGLFLSMFLPLSPLICAVIMVSLTTLYTLLSGFYGVVYVDIFQAGIIILTVVIICVMALSAIAGFDGNLGELAAGITGSQEWLSSAPHWQTTMPRGYEAYEALGMFMLLYLLRNILAGMGSGADQRFFGARNERECGLLTFFWTWLMAVRWPMMISFAVLGLFLVRDMFPEPAEVDHAAALVRQHVGDVPKHHWEAAVAQIINAPQRHPELVEALEGRLGQGWPQKVQLVSYEGTVNPERVLPAVILMLIPEGIRGLFLVALVAAAMSTFAPQVNMATAFFTRDVYQAFLRPKASNPELIAASYGFGIVLVLAGFGMAYTVESINHIWGWIIMGLGAGLAVPTLLRLYWWRFNAGGVVVATALGLAGALGQRLWAPDLDERLQFGILMTIGIAGALIGTYLTRPTDPKVLEHFYRTTRPFGFWGPLKATLSPQVRALMNQENRRDILAVPFALGWQVTLFLLPMQLIIGTYQSFAVTLAIFSVCLAGVYLLWYRHLPPPDTGMFPSTVAVRAEQAESEASTARRPAPATGYSQ